MITMNCRGCDEPFKSENKSQRYCDLKCRAKAQSKRKNVLPNWKNTPINCGICGKEFIRGENSSPMRKYCSDDCKYRAMNKKSAEFKVQNPDWVKNYLDKRREKYGTDTLINRLKKKYTDLPTACEAADCKEDRVLDIAHKPAHARMGAHRTMIHYERHMFWILCPNHHALIDRGVLKPTEIGLIE